MKSPDKRRRTSSASHREKHSFADGPAFYESLLRSLYDGVYFVDRDRVITYWNPAAEKLTGYRAKDAIGRHCYENFLGHVDDAGCALCLDGCPLASTIKDGRSRDAEVYLKHKNGHRVPVSVRVSCIRNVSGRIVGAVEVFSDISAKKKIERRAGELESLAFRDSLTGVKNRRYTEMKLAQAVEEAKRFGKKIGVLIIDLDHFKFVNDKYGHEIGDLVLRAVCDSLTASLRPFDLVGRWGGEEFVVLLSDLRKTALRVLAERCRMVISRSEAGRNRQHVRVTASIGGTLIGIGDSAKSVIRRADKLMYQSKLQGRNRVTIG